MSGTGKRRERDFLGERVVPADVYFGVQTLRARENFLITGVPIACEPEFIRSFAAVKKAAAMANRDLGALSRDVADAICDACDRLLAGEHHDQFVVDVIQGGAGTSTNMNVNEVIANLALEILGEPLGNYSVVHPNNHVNMAQSTNDTYPTALRIALYRRMEQLHDALDRLQASFTRKGVEFDDILKMGRTQLQDAVPMTLGQEFSAFAANIREDLSRLQEARELLTEVNLGATAIGTCINAPVGYPELATSHLRELTGVPVRLSRNLFEATWGTGAYVQISGALKRAAVKLSKICNDLRLLSSGPRAGLNEINLPPMQPGSSIMPGKVNPVIPEVVNQICYLVIGNDVTVSFASEAGQLQLNAMEPVIAYALFQSIRTLERGSCVLQARCVDGITANREVCESAVMNSVGIVTALTPLIGYEDATACAQEALRSGRSLYDVVVVEKGLVSQAQWDELYAPTNIVRPSNRAP